MKCPHCQTAIHPDFSTDDLGYDVDGYWRLFQMTCPSCHRFIMSLVGNAIMINMSNRRIPKEDEVLENRYVRPIGAQRPKAPPEVPTNIAADFNEACLVFPFSTKASAALSRRCLQHLLRDVVGVKHSNLSSEIEEVMPSLPSHLAESIDGIRNVGNFSAHPTKSKHSGEVVEVESGEAEWNLDVLEELFDYYCVKPERLKKKREALDAKLEKAGKPKMKSQGSKEKKK